MSGKVIRKPIIEDLNQIIDIENECFPTPWSKDVFLTIIFSKGKHRVDDDVFIFMDAMVVQDSVIGYIVWEESSYDENGHILNLAVNEKDRHQGNGRVLLEHSLKCMREAGMKTCELEVREGNQSARTLYSKAGMTVVDKIRRYYGDEDAIIYLIEF